MGTFPFWLGDPVTCHNWPKNPTPGSATYYEIVTAIPSLLFLPLSYRDSLSVEKCHNFLSHIASLDEAEESEAERWSERTAIITKIDHENYTSYARDIVEGIVAEVRTPEKKR